MTWKQRGPWKPNKDKVAQELLDAMGADNGVNFRPCSKHWSELLQLVSECLTQGLAFTERQINTIAYGEETEQAGLVKQYASGPALNKCLNQIFDGCKRCRIADTRFRERA